MDEARSFYKKSVKLLPEMAQAWYGIALTLEYDDRWYEAIHYVRKAIEKDESNPEYWLLLGDCEFNLNNLTEAAECYMRITEDSPSYIDGWLSYAHFLTETGDPAKAITETEKAILLHPECPELWYRQVINLYSDGQIQESYICMSSALELDDSQFNMVFELMPSLKQDQILIQLIQNKRNPL
jgi:tetratricopeptide (TPR) repeat protein